MGLDKEEKESRWLYAEDLLKDGKWTEATVTIEECIAPGTLKSADKRPVERTVLKFVKCAKMLVLNNTNRRLIKMQIGTEDQSKWLGRKITVYPTCLAHCFGESNVPAIRIRCTSGVPIPFNMRKQLGNDLTGQTLPQQ